MEPPMKRARLLSDDSASEDDSSEHSSSDAASDGQEAALHVNEEFAKRFQHNQERAEKHRLEEKYGKEDASSSDSDSESEDDEGELVTQELDEEIFATLNAIRNKDPRVYDKQSTFYNSAPEPSNQQTSGSPSAQKEKPIHLRDYHRKNLLKDAGELKPDNDGPPTYADEQSALKRDLLDQMHKTTVDDEGDPDNDDEGDFLIRKPGQDSKPIKKAPPQELDIEMADKDPETYLSNFMASRAWVPSAGSQFQPFESDDEEEEARADEFEHAFNMRFEDPERANEKLISHSRDLAAKQSVRRDEPKGRKKARDEAKARRDAEKLEREEEKARLRRLKIDEAHEKWMRLKEAAGLKKQHLSDEKLLKFLEQGFEGENWDQEMAKLLGETYYAEKEEESLDGDNDDEEDEEDGTKSSKKRVKKPKWDDDIDIGDIVPDFDEEEERQGQNFTLSDDDDDDNADNNEMQEDASDDEEDEDEEPGPGKGKVKSKDIKKKRADAKRESRLARRKIEELVDTQLLTELDAPAGSSSTGPFRYRETSPTTLGLSARDILMASDSQLNQFAGLKKLATFRDEEKKARERKKLSKKARLKQWRKETFGDERGGDAKSFEDYVNEARQTEEADFGVGRVQRSRPDADDGDIRGETGEKRKKKRKRSKKKSTGIAV